MNKTLSCKNLNAYYNNNLILNDISLEITQGEFICLAGKNGSGKSTLLKILSGLHKDEKSLKITSPHSTVCLNGIPLHTFTRKDCAKQIAYMQQTENSAWNVLVKDFIITGRFAYSGTAYTQHDFSILQESATLLGIHHLLERDIFSLSGGEFQKVRIARALTQTPDFLLLDEPTSALDLSYETELLQLLANLAKDKNIGILISIHNLNTALRFAEKLILLPPAPEKLIQGTPQQVITKENIQKTYGSDIPIFTHPLWNCPQIG